MSSSLIRKNQKREKSSGKRGEGNHAIREFLQHVVFEMIEFSWQWTSLFSVQRQDCFKIQTTNSIEYNSNNNNNKILQETSPLTSFYTFILPRASLPSDESEALYLIPVSRYAHSRLSQRRPPPSRVYLKIRERPLSRILEPP